jgi:ureidoglycolate lyase
MRGRRSHLRRPRTFQPLTVANFSPYGWLLGKLIRPDGSIPSFSNVEIDFWEEHVFDPGVGGETEVLWVTYRNQQRAVTSLEVHRLTQQAIVPLTGDIIQIVAGSRQDGSRDEGSLSAFRVLTRPCGDIRAVSAALRVRNVNADALRRFTC